MTPDTIMSMTHVALRIALYMAGPTLLASLIIGLTVSIFQAATQVNEMTLTFIPKLLGVAIVLIILGPWLMTTMVDYIQSLLLGIPDLVM